MDELKNIKIVAIKDMSCGNESVGEMWQETQIFDLETPIKEIVKWANGGYIIGLKKKITITVSEVNDA
jgi:hypothetical protein